MTVFLGLAVAFLWGSADTVALFATKRLGCSTTTFVAQLAGLFLIAFLGLVFAGPLGILTISAGTLVLGILFGVVLDGVSAGAYLSLYQALSSGPLAIVSPVVSAQGGVTLLLAVVVLHEPLASLQMLFLLVTFIGVLLASFNVEELLLLRPTALLRSPGMRYALLALLCFGVLAFGLGLAARSSHWFLSIFWVRCFSFLFLAVMLRSDPVKRKTTGRKGGYLLAVGVGCADVGGLALLSLATTSGSIGVAGMIVSAYGVLPLAVGVLYLKERLSLSQLLGCLILGTGVVGEATPSSEQELSLAGFAVALCVAVCVVLLYRQGEVARQRT